MKVRKRRSVGFFIAVGVATLIHFGQIESLDAQVTSNGISNISGYVYQGGRNSGLKQTTSQVSLPNLNEILAPTPIQPEPKPQPRVQKQVVRKVTPAKTVKSAISNPPNPRYGFGSPESSSFPTGPMGDHYDPLVPIDPGYDEEPVPPTHFEFPEIEKGKATDTDPKESAQHIHYHTHYHYGNNTVQQPQQLQSPQYIAPTNSVYQAYPFAHSYYPRSYLVYPYPRYYNNYGYIYPYHNIGRYPYGYSYGYPYSIYRSRVPLRGSLTSSINYLSGFRNPGVRFRFIF